jgi:hypothetical protein
MASSWYFLASCEIAMAAFAAAIDQAVDLHFRNQLSDLPRHPFQAIRIVAVAVAPPTQLLARRRALAHGKAGLLELETLSAFAARSP